MSTQKYKKAIVWGCPLHSHTHSYIHAAWYKALSHMGFETYWFHDGDYPKDFDYSNCIFITNPEQQIPIESSSVYFVHPCTEPQKFLDKGARLIEIRHNVKYWADYSHDYVVNKDQLQKIDDVTWYEKNASDNVLNDNFRKGVSGYEAVYLSWATDLLPYEFNTDDVYRPRENAIHYVGTLWSANHDELQKYATECQKNEIQFYLNDPWKGQPMSFEQNKEMVMRSYMAPDIRGRGATSGNVSAEKSNHLDNGYIPDRVLKSISYGQLGISNSPAVNELFNGLVIYNSDVSQLFYDGQAKIKDYELIKAQMEVVKQNHTYVNRINALLSVI